MNDGPNSSRYAVSVEATLLAPPACIPVTIKNISERGCRFTSAEVVAVGTPMAIQIGRVPPISGNVEWQVGPSHGMGFDRPLHDVILDHLRHFMSVPPALEPERSSDGFGPY